MRCETITALNLDPKNAPAQEGLQKIEQCTDGGTLDVTYRPAYDRIDTLDQPIHRQRYININQL